MAAEELLPTSAHKFTVCHKVALAVVPVNPGEGKGCLAMSGENRLEQFRAYRTRMNQRISELGHREMNRFFALDSATYRDGALDARTKELLGLVASLVLRCNDCVDYHLDRCVELGWSESELADAMQVALMVGGSIVIPHLRHAVETLDLLRAEKEQRLS